MKKLKNRNGNWADFPAAELHTVHAARWHNAKQAAHSHASPMGKAASGQRAGLAHALRSPSRDAFSLSGGAGPWPVVAFGMVA
jgi:hypothetical protein